MAVSAKSFAENINTIRWKKSATNIYGKIYSHHFGIQVLLNKQNHLSTQIFQFGCKTDWLLPQAPAFLGANFESPIETLQDLFFFFFFHFIILRHGKRQYKTKNYKHFLDWAHDDRLLSVVRSCINVLFRPYISNNNSLHNPTSVSETCRLPCNQLVFDYPTISRWTNSVIPQY